MGLIRDFFAYWAKARTIALAKLKHPNLDKRQPRADVDSWFRQRDYYEKFGRDKKADGPDQWRDRWIGEGTGQTKQASFATEATYANQAHEFHLQEAIFLRGEILHLKDREVVGERFAVGGLAATYSLYLQFDMSALILLGPVVYLSFSILRFREYVRNIYEIDCYLREIECLFDKKGGWVNYFFMTRYMNSYFISREWMWYGLLMLSIVGFLIFGGAELFRTAAEIGHRLGWSTADFL